MYVYVGVCVCV